MHKELYIILVTTAWLMSATVVLINQTFQKWQFYPVAVTLLLAATYLLPLLIHIKKPKQANTEKEYALFDADDEKEYTVTRATFKAIERTNRIKQELQEIRNEQSTDIDA